jgi:hypothetical protein
VPFAVPDNLIVIDTETGGLTPGRHPLIEVAYGAVADDRLTVLWNADWDPADCDPAALRLNRCAERGPSAAAEVLTEPELAERLRRDLSGAVLIAANPHFDAGHVAQLLLAHGLIDSVQRPPWSYRLIDLKSLAVGFLAACGQLPAMPPNGWGQADVAECLPVADIPFGLEHTAAGDVLQVRHIARHILS